MKSQPKNNQVREAILIGAILVALVVFCYVSHLSLIIPFLILFLGAHLQYFKKADTQLFLQLGLLLAIMTFVAYAIVKYYPSWSPYYIPVASISILVVLLYNDLQLSFVMAFLCSMIVGLIAGNDFHLMLIVFLGSLMGSYCVMDARTRGKLIKAGILVGFIQVIVFILLRPAVEFIVTKNFVVNFLTPIFLSGIISVFVVIATLKVFETLFGLLTNFSLLELADFNQPLLKRMILEAPGTYHHSLMVSNIAESAADAIGANALLTRVGAYYHDIGKLITPEYFTENQMVEKSKHDNMEPSMSRLVILNHVKEGVELARKYKLNQRIIDFIPQHHGTGLIYYFYQRALESAAQDEVVKEENFRYPGPKPQSRETAIVLLADSVEGAVRALEDPTPSRIDEVVRKVINNKFIDGQLDECDLTLRNIDKISATFSRVLGAMYHTRVKYPEKKTDNGYNHKKSAEENPSKPSSNHQSPQEGS